MGSTSQGQNSTTPIVYQRRRPGEIIQAQRTDPPSQTHPCHPSGQAHQFSQNKLMNKSVIQKYHNPIWLQLRLLQIKSVWCYVLAPGWIIDGWKEYQRSINEYVVEACHGRRVESFLSKSHVESCYSSFYN